jgi:hypothetical protein
MTRILKRGVFALAAVVAVLLLSYLGGMILRGSPFSFAGETRDRGDLWIAAATMAGVVVGSLVSGLRQLPPRARVTVAQLLDLLLRPGMFIALCVSPVVLYGVLVVVNSEETGFLSMLAAFQNGFFWEQVLKGRH